MSNQDRFIEVTRTNGGKPIKYLINTAHIVKLSHNGRTTVMTTICEEMFLQESYSTVKDLLCKPEQEEDGWSLNTGRQPVSDSMLVEVLFRNINTSIVMANEWDWRTHNIGCDILKWRLAKEGN